jgi:ferredoxin-NADP reductase
VRLLSNDPETPTTRRIRLALDGQPFVYRAGQAASLAVESVERTPYSIASAPHETAQRGWLEFLVKVDGSSRFGAVVDRLVPGTRISVEGPIGRFVLPEVPRSTPLLMIGGGTGIAPLRSMICQALHDGHSNRLTLVYSSRTPSEFAYMEEFTTLAGESRLSLVLTLTGAADDWAHSRGRAGAEHLAEVVKPETLAFVCGPPGMVEDVRVALASLGVRPENVRSESY